MSRSADGIRAARAFLGLLGDFSAEEFRAAEKLLGNDKDLLLALQHMRRFSERDSLEGPLTVEGLRKAVQQFVETQGVPVAILSDILRSLAVHFSDLSAGLKNLPAAENSADIFRIIEILPPRSQVDVLVQLLGFIIRTMGEPRELMLFLRSLAEKAILENEILLPTPHSIAQMRMNWSKEPLGFSTKDTRAGIIRRLLDDAEVSADSVGNLCLLLREGLRSPSDTAGIRIYGKKKNRDV